MNRVRKQKQKRIDPHLLARIQASHKPDNGDVVHVSSSTPTTTIEPTTAKSLKNVTIHPLLLGKSEPEEPVKLNPLKKRGFNVNPYLDQTTIRQQKKRDLKFNELGKYIDRANELRREQDLQRDLARQKAILESKGLVPNILKGEDKYQPQQPPSIEWWDQIYLIERHYNLDRNKFMELSEDNPITHYIQFPVLSKIREPNELKLYLTKKELKKKRRVERLIKHKQEQEKIRAGLVPTPAPKVKLKNLMSVLTNDVIQDPTLLELKIQNEISERHLKHEQMNEERKLAPEDRALKKLTKQQERLSHGVYCCVFKIRILSNAYKVNVNAMQLNLKGCTVTFKDMTMIIVEGDFKNIDKYSKLLLNRINWNIDKDGSLIPDNKCELLHKFKQQDFKFKKWFNKEFDNQIELIEFLQLFNIENFFYNI